MADFYTVNICGRKENLPIIELKEGLSIAFFNLHGNQDLTEYCGKMLAKRIKESGKQYSSPPKARACNSRTSWRASSDINSMPWQERA